MASAETQLLGFSMTKSVTSALTGILVRQGKLKLDGPAPVAAWQRSGRSAPRHHRRSIAASHRGARARKFVGGLARLRARAGQPHEIHRRRYGRLCREHAARDRAGHGVELSRRQHPHSRAADPQRRRRPARGCAAFARRELFAPLGMRNVTLQLDGAGTIEGSGEMLASARDWARFGQLYLDDGVVGGKRILPEGWVNYSATADAECLGRDRRGLLDQSGDSFGAKFRVAHGWPRDAFFAKGTIGQYTIVIPSEKLVIVRMGRSPNWPPQADGVFDLVRDVMAATRERETWRAAISAMLFSFSHKGRGCTDCAGANSTAAPAPWPSRHDRTAPAS